VPWAERVHRLAAGRKQVEEMLQWSRAHGKFEKHAVLFLMSYAFLLRLPSEALPARAGKGSGPAALYLEGDQLVLELDRRCVRFARALPLHSRWLAQGRTDQEAAGWCAPAGARNRQ